MSFKIFISVNNYEQNICFADTIIYDKSTKSFN